MCWSCRWGSVIVNGMTEPLLNLPDNVDDLKVLVQRQAATLAERDRHIEHLKEQLRYTYL